MNQNPATKTSFPLQGQQRTLAAGVTFEEIGPKNLGQLIYAPMQEKIRIGVTLSKKVTVGTVEFTKTFNLPELGIKIRDLLY